jgi:molybdopterin synthase sulfur carrier subunit
MIIEVNLYASLSKYRDDGRTSGPIQLETDAEISILELLIRMGVPRKDVKLVFRNGVHAGEDEMVGDGDRLGIFPPIGGG